MEIKEVTGYKFATVEIANERMAFLNEYHGLPINGFESQFSNESYFTHPDGFFYIWFSQKWTSILGDPEVFTIEINP